MPDTRMSEIDILFWCGRVEAAIGEGSGKTSLSLHKLDLWPIWASHLNRCHHFCLVILSVSSPLPSSFVILESSFNRRM